MVPVNGILMSPQAAEVFATLAALGTVERHPRGEDEKARRILEESR